MKISIGCDHAAVAYKNMIRDSLREQGHEVLDLGIEYGEKADYPDIAEKVSLEVSEDRCERGILICGTGIGMSIAANKVKGIRAAAVSDPVSARLCREHNDANVLCFGERIVGSVMAEELVRVFLSTDFLGERHQRRVEKIIALEEK